MKVFAVALIAAAFLQLCGVVECALSIIVESGEEECFVVRTAAGETSIISGNYEALDDNLSPGPLGATLYNDKEAPMWRSKPGASEDKFSIHGEGKFELCFQNGRLGHDDMYAPQDGEDREVGFNLRVTAPSRDMGDAGPENRLMTNLSELTIKLLDGLHTMSDHQEYMRERENRHTLLAAATFDRVVQWTILEAMVLMLISLGQVLYLKKFFEQRRYL